MTAGFTGFAFLLVSWAKPDEIIPQIKITITGIRSITIGFVKVKLVF